MFIDKISHKGLVIVKFSEGLKVVNLTTTPINETDILLEIVPSDPDEVDIEILKFTWIVESYTSDNMIIEITFENPVEISAHGKNNDELRLTVLNPVRFWSERTKLSVKAGTKTQNSIPSQLEDN